MPASATRTCIAQLESIENVARGFLSYGALKFDPDFDSLRGDPRFETIIQVFRKPVDLSKFQHGGLSSAAHAIAHV